MAGKPKTALGHDHTSNSKEKLSTREEDIRIKEEYYSGESCEVLYRPDPGDERAGVEIGGYLTFKHELDQREEVVRDDILVNRDVAIPLRDGTTIYADIFRPAEKTTHLPAIVNWGFYGKGNYQIEQEWHVLGVPEGTISNLQKFEAADPAYWCRNGYAVVNVDGRGAGQSEGNVCLWGEQDGRDGYDAIEWLAGQYWSNGRVGLFGNSALAMCQWWIAAEQPPHLACMAPWEGTSDIYREFIGEDGIPHPAFSNMVMSKVRSFDGGHIEDLVNMMEEYPLMNPYWEAKIPRFEKIEAPAYICAGWLHIHVRGSINAFNRISSEKKWLRIHREHEWTDDYEYLEDLKKFFDRYLRDIRNGWELTPRVRMELMDVFNFDYQVCRPENEFPLARTEYKKLYLDASSHSLSWEPIGTEASVSYDSESETATFDITFDEDTEITGYMKLHTFVAAESHDEMDLIVHVEKLDENGNLLPLNGLGVNGPEPGAWGMMRVSHRELDEELSTDIQPVQAHRREQKLTPGEIVPVDIEIFPHGRIWHKGQKLRLEFRGKYARLYCPYAVDNKGNHIIYAGGQYDSFLQIPVIPPKYQAGEYVYR